MCARTIHKGDDAGAAYYSATVPELFLSRFRRMQGFLPLQQGGKGMLYGATPAA
jgi:hypothetical protein